MGRENHFVPQFYLRNFSSASSCTSLFNFAGQRFISKASIKHQCSRRNLYEYRSDLENDFAELESDVSSVLRKVEKDGNLPDAGSDDWITLLTFIVFQQLRTPGAAQLSDNLAEYMGQLVMEGDSRFTEYESDIVKFKREHSVALTLSSAAEILPLALQLKAHLFVNITHREFITSDDPVVLHNQYCEGIDYKGSRGWDCAGIQAFWPISPSKLVVLYDRDTYIIPGSGVSKLSREADVAQLNSLQILNAKQNVYFAGRERADRLIAQCRELSGQRPSSRSTFVESESMQSLSRNSGSLLHFFEELLPINLKVSKIRVNKQSARVPLDQRVNMGTSIKAFWCLLRSLLIRKASSHGRFDRCDGRSRPFCGFRARFCSFSRPSAVFGRTGAATLRGGAFDLHQMHEASHVVHDVLQEEFRAGPPQSHAAVLVNVHEECQEFRV